VLQSGYRRYQMRSELANLW